MTNEAIRVEGPYETHDFTISGVTAVPMGTLMVLSGLRTATASTGAANEKFAGIAATEKKAGDVSTELGCDTKGIYDLTVSGTGVVAGQLVALGEGVNNVTQATTDMVLSGVLVGKALEDISNGSTGEVHVGEGI